MSSIRDPQRLVEVVAHAMFRETTERDRRRRARPPEPDPEPEGEAKESPIASTSSRDLSGADRAPGRRAVRPALAGC